MNVEYNPNFIFTPVSVIYKSDCFFCTVPITPETDDWTVHIGLPGKPIIITHPACFEQLAWSMTKFVMDTNGNLTPEVVVN